MRDKLNINRGRESGWVNKQADAEGGADDRRAVFEDEIGGIISEGSCLIGKIMILL